MLSTIRHNDIFNPQSFKTPITIIGAGATGSRVFAALVELGLTNIKVVDFDRIEAHNLANQIYSAGDVGLSKVDGLKFWAQQKLGTPDLPVDLKFCQTSIPDPEIDVDGVVFLLTDTMASRREIYEQCLQGNEKVDQVIETRMASTHGNVLMFNPQDPFDSEDWVSTLIDDEEGEVSACGTSITVGTTASIIANMAVWQFIHWANDPVAADARVDLFLKPFCMTTGSLK